MEWSDDSDFESLPKRNRIPPNNGDAQTSEDQGKSSTDWLCRNCNVGFSQKRSLRRHYKTCGAGKGTRCFIKDCSMFFYHKVRIFEHVQNQYNEDNATKEHHTFNTMEEFKSWKDTMEKKEYAAYTQQTTSDIDGKYSYFICQFDGSAKSHVTNNQKKTSRKSKKGRAKTGATCLARMCVVSRDDGKLDVTFYRSHCHELTKFNLCYQQTSVTDKIFIQEKLASHVPLKEIQRQLRFDLPSRDERKENGNGDYLERRHVLTITALNAMARRRKASSERLDEDDAKSTLAYVYSLTKEKYNPILIDKPFGTEIIIGDKSLHELPNWKDIFILGFQTEAQLEMMKKQASKILCIDATHGTNCYDYKLVNLVVRDEYGKGYPVGHFITSKLDTDSFRYMFKSLKAKCPDISSCLTAIMTDDDQALRNAIVLEFGEQVKGFLCWLHVKRSWFKKLKELQGVDKAKELFKYFVSIMEENNVNDFNKLVQGLSNKLSEEGLLELQEYFSLYIPRAKEWAACYRAFPHGDTNSNMLVESFHNVLKTHYLFRGPNRRIDALLRILLLIEKDFYDRRFVDLNFRPPEIQNSVQCQSRHARGLRIPDVDISHIDSTSRNVRSQSNKAQSYIIHQIRNSCEQQDHCFIKCLGIECVPLCSHLYNCTCQDNFPLCKHVHKLHSFLTWLIN